MARGQLITPVQRAGLYFAAKIFGEEVTPKVK